LIELLESFSEKELKDLLRIATYPYFNTDKYVVKLLEVLKNKVLGKNLSNAAMQNKIYDTVFFDLPKLSGELNKKQKALLNSKISSLTRLAERFLRMEALENSKTKRCELLMESLLEKQFYYLIYTGEWRKNNNLNKLNKFLNAYYLNVQLIITNNALSMKEVNPKDNFNLSVFKLMDMDIFYHHINNKNPYIKVQIAILNLQVHKTQVAFDNLLQLLDKHEEEIPNNELKEFYTSASNFCIHQTKAGKTEYFQIYTDLHKTLDKKKLLVFNNSLSIEKIINLVIHACKIGEFYWANNQKKFQHAIDLLSEVNNFQKNYDIEKRILILKSYYELEQHYTEPTAQLFRSLETFIKNHQSLSSKDKTMFKTFIRIFYNLYRIKHRVGKIGLDKLKDRIDNAEFISNKLWLLEKIAELEGRK